jgi:hypothetical protein
MKKVYNGILVSANNGEEDDLLGLMREDSNHHWDTSILAEEIKEDMWNGNYLSVSYYISNQKMSEDELIESFLQTLYGEGDVKYGARYSEITGYLWTDEDLNVGGHDLLEELKSNIGKWLYMEIEFNKEPKQ